MPRTSAGILLFRRGGAEPEVLLVHPGGPYWVKKDDGAWSIPKGEYDEGDNAVVAARREFFEELGSRLPAGRITPLGEVRQKGGKRVVGFAAEGDLDPAAIRSNSFEMVWPPRSGRMRSFPEIDRAGWFDPELASQKIIEGQRPLLDRLWSILGLS